MESILSSLKDVMDAFSFVTAFGLAAAYFIVDAMYAHYTLSVAELKAVSAANTGSLMHFIIAFGVLSYVQNYLYVIPIAIGSWFGTYMVVSRESGGRGVAAK